MRRFIIGAFLSVLAFLPTTICAQTTSLSFEPFSIKAGQTKQLVIDLNNPDMQVWMMQFDLRLSEGLSVTKNSKNKFEITKTDRAESHTISSNENNGIIKVLLNTLEEEAISGSAGALINVNIAASTDFTTGQIVLENIKVTNLDNDKFSLADVTLSVGPKPVTVTVNDATRKYGEANPSFTCSVEPTDVDLTGKLTYTCEATPKSNVGDYAITATSNSEDYIVTCVPGKLTVTKASLKVKAKDAERAYGADNAAFAFTYEGFANGETESVLTKKPVGATTATKSSPVGQYDITVSGAEAANYDITEYVKGQLTVKPAVLTVKAGNASRVYGGSNPEFTYTVSGFVNDETEAVMTTIPTVSTTATTASGAGTYAIKASGAVAPNYSFSYTDGTLTVTKAPLKATVKDATRVYGGTANYEFEYSGFVNGDTKAAVTTAPTVTSTATKTSPVGEYTTSLSGGSAANYEFTEYVGGKLTITKAPLWITAKNAERSYGYNNPAFAFSYEGFANGETESVLTKKPVGATTATKSSPVGKYDITVSGAEATNYDIIDYVKGTLTVTPAVVTVNVGNYTRVYGQNNPEFTYTLTGFVNNETESVLTTRPTLSTVATNSSNVGQYAVNASGAVAPNYSFSYTEGLLTITKASLKVTADDVTWMIGSEWPTFAVTYQGFVNNETESVLTKKPVAATTATKDSPEGTYAITVSGGKATNYDFEYVSGTLTIIPDNTGICSQRINGTFDVYNLRGQKVRAGVNSLNDLPKGLYIINGQKVTK